MRITKRPKRVMVKYIKIKSFRSSYQCPSCKTEFQGYVNRNTTRFICSCGQELIVDKK